MSLHIFIYNHQPTIIHSSIVYIYMCVCVRDIYIYIYISYMCMCVCICMDGYDIAIRHTSRVGKFFRIKCLSAQMLGRQ